MEFKELMEDFARRIGLGELKAGEDGTYAFEVDGMELTVTEIPARNAALLLAQVGELPTEAREDLLKLLMRANFTGRGTQGATLSMDPEGDGVFLHRTLSLPAIDCDGFCAAFERFVNTVGLWRRQMRVFRPIGEEIVRMDEEARSMSNASILGTGACIKV